MFNKWIRPYFQFSRQERWGAFLLVGALFGLYGLASIFPKRKLEADPPPMAQVKKGSAKTESLAYPSEGPPETKLRHFDPNRLSESEWIELGISPKTARTIGNYRAKGGRFRVPEDLGKIWGLRPADRDRLLPFVRIRSEPDRSKTAAITSRVTYATSAGKKPISISVDINRSDSVDWEGLPGIGPTYARRILRYRDRLGGFVHLDQIAETYQLPDSVFQNIRPHLRSGDLGQIRKISLNTVTIDTLGRHPYCNFSLARSIIRYREQHGPFRKLEDLLELHQVDSSWWLRIRPYLSL